MPRLELPHRQEGFQIGPLAGGRRALFLQHLVHLVPDLPELFPRRSDNVAGHDGGRRLPERAGLHLLAEVRHHPVLHGEVDGHLGAAKPRNGHRRGIRMLQALQPGNICRKTQYLAVVNVVNHTNILAHTSPAANGPFGGLP